jgi:hypothetical protein
MTQQKLSHRIDKINMLKDLQAGRKTIKELSMPEQYMFYEMESGLFHVNSSQLTRAELDAYINIVISKQL